MSIKGFINYVAYIQHEIDNILHDVQDWAKAYINNIIFVGSSPDNFLHKLRVMM